MLSLCQNEIPPTQSMVFAFIFGRKQNTDGWFYSRWQRNRGELLAPYKNSVGVQLLGMNHS
jgi:hypothetical protein